MAAEKVWSALNKVRAKQAKAVEPQPEALSAPWLRFSAKGLASNRKRLGLSAEQFGLLVGVGSQSIYNWEAGEARPRQQFLQAIADLKTIGKRNVSARLQALKQKSS